MLLGLKMEAEPTYEMSCFFKNKMMDKVKKIVSVSHTVIKAL